MFRRVGACVSLSVASRLTGGMRAPTSGAIRRVSDGPGSSSRGTTTSGAPSINSVSLVGVAHDIQSGFVFEESVLQFTLTTTSLQTGGTVPSSSSPASSTSAGAGKAGGSTGTTDCVVEKDHHVVRCFGELFSQEVQQKVKEGSVVCVNGRLRLNPQLEPSVNKYYYFPYIQVQPPHGQVSVVYSDRSNPPQATEATQGTVEPTSTNAPPSPSS